MSLEHLISQPKAVWIAKVSERVSVSSKAATAADIKPICFSKSMLLWLHADNHPLEKFSAIYMHDINEKGRTRWSILWAWWCHKSSWEIHLQDKGRGVRITTNAYRIPVIVVLTQALARWVQYREWNGNRISGHSPVLGLSTALGSKANASF